MKSKIPCDGLYQAQVSRIIKSLELATTCINCLGFALLIIKAFFFANNLHFIETLTEIFTFLIFTQVVLNISVKYWMFRTRIINKIPTHQPLTFRTQAYGTIKSFQNIWDLLHFLLIFVQPNIFFPKQIIHHIYNIAPIRVYTIIRSALMMKFLLNPRFLRVCKFFSKSKPLLALKVAYKKYFIISITSFIGVIVVGFGNLMKDQEVNLFEDIYVASYYIFVTVSTVGYGDYIPNSLLARMVTVVILISGVFIMSLLTYAFLKESKLNDQQSVTYYHMKKLETKEEAMNFLTNQFVKLIDQSISQERVKKQQDNKIYITHLKNNVEKQLNNKIFQRPVSMSKKSIFQQQTLSPKSQQLLNSDIDQIYYAEEQLQSLGNQIQYLDLIDPIKILMARHQIHKIKKKIIPLLLTTLQLLDIVKPKKNNAPGHRSFYTKQQL